MLITNYTFQNVLLRLFIMLYKYQFQYWYGITDVLSGMQKKSDVQCLCWLSNFKALILTPLLTNIAVKIQVISPNQRAVCMLENAGIPVVQLEILSPLDIWLCKGRKCTWWCTEYCVQWVTISYVPFISVLYYCHSCIPDFCCCKSDIQLLSSNLIQISMF